MFSSALPSECDGEQWFIDTLRPHADYGSCLNPDCLKRLVPMLLRSRRKTTYRQPGFLTPAPYMESEPPRHSPFFHHAPVGRDCDGNDPCGRVAFTYTAFSGDISSHTVTDVSSGLFLEVNCHALSDCSILLSFSISVCLSSSVTLRGVASSMFSCLV